MWGDTGGFGSGVEGYQATNNYTSYGGNAGFSSPQMGSQEQQRGGKSQSMLPVTVHQLMDVEQQGDSYYINGREVHQESHQMHVSRSDALPVYVNCCR
jgi:hypothetical protein